MKKKVTILFGIFVLMTLIAINNVSAQTPLPTRCKPVADQIYFVDSGQSVIEVRPGGNGYQLIIIGTEVDKFQLVKEPYMTSVSLISATAAQAKWQVFFSVDRIRFSVQSSEATPLGDCIFEKEMRFK
jgi:hypothetical protein